MRTYGSVTIPVLVAISFSGDSAMSHDASGDASASSSARAGVVPISTTGSLQNPCFSPDGSKLVFTRFRRRYNMGLSDIMLVDVTGGTPVRLSTTNAQNVNLPGSCWDANTHQIVFTGDPEDGDQIYVVSAAGGPARQVSHLIDKVAWEPSFSPDGQWITFEAHSASDTTVSPGTIWKIRADGSDLTQLTSGADDRQPNWSARGDLIVFQRLGGASLWDLFTVSPAGGEPNNVTTSTHADETDASFTPDGRYIVYSGDAGTLAHAGLWVIPSGGVVPWSGDWPIRIGAGRTSYDGAPSVSPDGKWVAFETTRGDPDGSTGSKIEILPLPVLP